MAWLANQLEVRCCEIPLGYEVDVAATAQAELLDVTGLLEAEERSFLAIVHKGMVDLMGEIHGDVSRGWHEGHAPRPADQVEGAAFCFL